MGWYERRVFNPLLDRGLDTEVMGSERAALLCDVRGRVLEIGPGTGLNFEHYPDAVQRITTISPEEELAPQARARAAARGATLRHFTQAKPPWPFADGLFESVVSTLVLCTIPDIAATLAEVRRVLTPDGRLLVFEHVLDEAPLRATCQHLARPFSRVFACGCNPNRRTREAIEEAGFEWERLESRTSPALPWLVGTVVVGVARPRA